jgi:hypothetical protein
VLLTFLGALLAVPVGFIPAAVFISLNNMNLPLVFPWRVVAVVLLVVPVTAGIVTTLGSRVALWVRPVRVSKMAFDSPW